MRQIALDDHRQSSDYIRHHRRETMAELGSEQPTVAHEGIVEQIQRHAAWGVPLELFVYFTGYLAMSSFAARVGLPTSSLLEPQYVATGIWILTPLAAVATLIHAGAASIKGSTLEPVGSVKEWWAEVRAGLPRLLLMLFLLGLAYTTLILLVLPMLALVGPRFSVPSVRDSLLTAAWLITTSRVFTRLPCT
ncbi:MAG TPA: hypothetical protein VGN72_24115 [Tepidisphaeraceae bacterium]|jgi:hypothetical protein|nr:hypothetical protein [Tepidisphaeraceae bacterium]